MRRALIPLSRLVVVDLYSRAVVGFVVAERENSQLAEAMCAEHGVARSLNRPNTSNDNPHAVSVFRILKTRTYYLKIFTTLAEIV